MQVYTDETLIEFDGDYCQLAVEINALLMGARRPLPPKGDPFWTASNTVGLLDQLLEEMNERAPEGYYFGQHTVWPDSFGFWKQGVSHVDPR